MRHRSTIEASWLVLHDVCMDSSSPRPSRSRSVRWTALLLGIGATAASCGVVPPTDDGADGGASGGTPTTEAAGASTNPELDGFVRDVTDWEAISPSGVELGRRALEEPVEGDPVELEVEITDEDGGTSIERRAFVCTTQTHSLSTNPREVVLADGTAGMIWPGALVDGAAHVQGSIRPIAIASGNRAPLGVSVAGGGVLGIRGGVSTVVDQPTGSTVREGVNQLVANALESDVATGAGYSSFQSVESHSAEQTMLDIGLSGRYLRHEASAQLHYGHQASERTHTAYFIQRLYTVAVDAPQRPSDFFTESMTPEEMSSLGIGPDSPPLYVGSVSYGRILMYSITSTASAQQISGAIEYSYDSFAGGASAEVAASHERTLAESRIEVMAVGGPNTGVSRLIQSGDLASYFEADLALNQVEPIAFTLHRLSDNQVAEVVDTTEYEQRTCEQVGAPLPQPIHWWPLDGGPEDAAGDADMGGNDIYGAGRIGQGLVFDGATDSANVAGYVGDEYVEQVVPTDGPFSVSAWVFPRTDGPGTVLSQVGEGHNAGDFAIRIINGHLYFWRRPVGGSTSVDNSTTWFEGAKRIIPNNEWTHVTVVFGAEASTAIQLYVNGEDKTGTVEPSVYTSTRGDSITRIGTSEISPLSEDHSAGTRYQHPFNGVLDEVMVFDRALSPDEVAVMYQNVGDDGS